MPSSDHSSPVDTSGPAPRPGILTNLRASPAAAWAGPLILFMLFMLVSSAFKSETPGAPWWQAQPAQWVYPIQTVCVLGAIAFWWRHYTFRPLTAAHMGLAVAAGTVGIVLWILPSWLYDNGFTAEIPWLGFTSRSGDGFNPTLWQDNPALYWSVVVMRFLRMVVAVAFAEELFWRGFLWRAVSDPYRDFSHGPFGTWNWKALGAVVALFAVSHLAPDRLGAVVWCLIISGLYVRTKSVGACVLAHAVSNLLLGIYVMVTRQWGFW